MTEPPRSWLFLADKFKKSCSMLFKNLPLSFSFAESTVLRRQLNCKTFFVVILNGICLLTLNIRVKTLSENFSCNYKHQHDNHERYCGWFWVRCSSKKFERMAQQAVDVCLRVLEESNKRRFDNYTVRNSVLIVSHITSRACHVHIFAHNLSRNSCILNSVIHLLNNWGQIDNNKSFYRQRHSY